MRRTVRGTRRFTRMTLLRHPVSVFARRRLAPLVLDRPKIRATIETALAQLDISYASRTDRRPAGSGLPAPVAGDRAPDVRLREPGRETVTHLLCVLRDDEFSLLVFPATPAQLPYDLVRSMLAAHPGLVRAWYVVTDDTEIEPHTAESALRDHDGHVRGRYGIGREGMVLIRPDGYVAERSESRADTAVADYLHRWLGGDSTPAEVRRTGRSRSGVEPEAS